MTDVLDATTALDRVVAAARQMEAHEDVDRWEFSSDVAEAVDAVMAGVQNRFELVGRGQRHPGFNEALDKVNGEITKAGVLSVGRQSIVGAYTTAKAWPQESRVEGATYWAHYELRAKDYDQRRNSILSGLVRKSRDGRIGPKDVRLWRSNLRQPDMTPRDEKLEKGLRSALRRWATPQAFRQLHQDEQAAAVKILRRLAGEIELGEFE